MWCIVQTYWLANTITRKNCFHYTTREIAYERLNEMLIQDFIGIIKPNFYDSDDEKPEEETEKFLKLSCSEKINYLNTYDKYDYYNVEYELNKLIFEQ